jgi:hypothetical protein
MLFDTHIYLPQHQESLTYLQDQRGVRVVVNRKEEKQERELGVCPASQKVKGGVNPNSNPGPEEEMSLTVWGKAVPCSSGQSNNRHG